VQVKTELFLNRIARLQAATLLTQKEVLKKIRLSKAMLSYVRNGTHPPSVKVLRRLAQAEHEANISVETEPQLNFPAVHEAQTSYGLDPEELRASLDNIQSQLNALRARLPPALKIPPLSSPKK
jgi:transcriptional regulator with XRE-family HTH domain